MDPFDIGSYKASFLSSASEIIAKIRSSLLNNGQSDELRRFFHNLKGQCLFMKLDQTGQLCLNGEKLLENFVNTKAQLDETAKKTLTDIVSQVDLDLKKYENIDR